MGAELKLIFEGLDQVKKKIEEAFKTGMKIDVDKDRMGGKGKVPQSFITGQKQFAANLKQNIDALEGLKKSMNRFKDFSKIQEINNKIMKENAKITKIETNIAKATGVGGVKGGKGAKGGKGMAGMAILMGGMIGLMMQLVQSTKSIQFILQFIGGLIDALIGPLIPILLTLLKPFLTIFLFLAQFMAKFFMDPVGALRELFTDLLDGMKNLVGFGGKDKQKGAVSGLGAIAGGGIGFAVGGPVGALIGTMLGPLIGKLAFGLGEWIGNLLGTFHLWLNDLTGGEVTEFFNGIVDFFSGLWDILAGIFTLDWQRVKDGFFKMFDGFWNIITYPFEAAWELLKTLGQWIYDKFKESLATTWELLKGFGNWIWDTITGILATSLNVLSDIGSWIKKKIQKLWEGTKAVGEKLWSGVKSTVGIDDGVVSPNGRVISINPKDYLIATKNPKDLMGDKGNGNNITINLTVNGNADRSMIDTIKRELRRELSAKGAF